MELTWPAGALRFGLQAPLPPVSLLPFPPVTAQLSRALCGASASSHDDPPTHTHRPPLRRALRLKRVLRERGAAEAGAAEEAATLHNLAVVAIADRPPRLEAAEALLQARVL